MDSTAILWGDLFDQFPTSEQDCIKSTLGDDLFQEIRQEPISSDGSMFRFIPLNCVWLLPEAIPAVMQFSLMVNEVLLGTSTEDEIPPDTRECIRNLLADTDVGAVLATILKDPGTGMTPNQEVTKFAAGIGNCAPQSAGLTGLSDSTHPTPAADSILWQQNLAVAGLGPRWVVNAPTVSNGVVYVGADDGNLYALDTGGGGLLWSFQTDDVVRSPATVSNGVVYVGSNDNNLYALDAASGDLLWQHDTGGPVQYAPLLGEDVVYVPTISEGGRRVHALDAASGTQLWAASQYYPFDSGYESGVGASLAGNMLLVIDDSGGLHALNTQTGETNWSFRGDVGTDTPPVAIGDVVYITAVNTAHALDLQTGAELWKYGTDRFPAQGFTPVVDGGVYYFAPDDHLYALDTSTGDPIWTYQLDSMASTAPVVTDSIVYIASESGGFYALDQQTGDVRWSIEADATILESPGLADGVLYLESSDGYLLALDALTGDELWGFSKGFFSGIRTYTLADGVLYFSSLNGAIYAIDASAAAMR